MAASGLVGYGELGGLSHDSLLVAGCSLVGWNPGDATRLDDDVRRDIAVLDLDGPLTEAGLRLSKASGSKIRSEPVHTAGYPGKRPGTCTNNTATPVVSGVAWAKHGYRGSASVTDTTRSIAGTTLDIGKGQSGSFGGYFASDGTFRVTMVVSGRYSLENVETGEIFDEWAYGARVKGVRRWLLGL